MHQGQLKGCRGQEASCDGTNSSNPNAGIVINPLKHYASYTCTAVAFIVDYLAIVAIPLLDELNRWTTVRLESIAVTVAAAGSIVAAVAIAVQTDLVPLDSN
jgi:hypothetical protein